MVGWDLPIEIEMLLSPARAATCASFLCETFESEELDSAAVKQSAMKWLGQ